MTVRGIGEDGAFAERYGMAFQILVLEDASRQADLYWRNVLWQRVQPEFAPSEGLLAGCAFDDRPSICEAWNNWFGVLTSWEFAEALTGRELREVLFESSSSP